MLSPGEQPRTPSLGPRRLWVLLLFTALLAVYLQTQAGNILEYRLYFTEDRRAAQLSLLELHEGWSEATLRQRFAGHPVTCEPYRGDMKVQRACAVDVGSLNGVSALFLSFFFADGRLSHVSVNVPWWAHRAALKSLVDSFGQPVASQRLPHQGVRLHGWSLANGAAVFMNRDRPLNPLSWNSIHWRSASSCRSEGCLAAHEP